MKDNQKERLGRWYLSNYLVLHVGYVFSASLFTIIFSAEVCLLDVRFNAHAASGIYVRGAHHTCDLSLGFSHSFFKYLLRTNWVLGPILSTSVRQRDENPYPLGTYILVGKENNNTRNPFYSTFGSN